MAILNYFPGGAKPKTQEKTVSGSLGGTIVTPDEGKLLSKVTVGPVELQTEALEIAPAFEEQHLPEIGFAAATLPLSARWQSIAYGAGKFVALAYNSNKFAYSEDGVNWTEAAMPSSANWQSVAYGNGRFVAVTYSSNKAAYSEDGIHWTASTLPYYSPWTSVAYGAGKFVAVMRGNNSAYYSEDGIAWTQMNMPSTTGWQSVTYGNGRFVAVAYASDKAAYSTNGVTWTEATMPSYANWQSVAYGDGKFVAVVLGSNKAAYSANGQNWTAVTLPSRVSCRAVAYGNGRFVVAASGYYTAQSVDCETWTEIAMPSNASWAAAVYGNGRFVMVAENANKAAHCVSTFYSSVSVEAIPEPEARYGLVSGRDWLETEMPPDEWVDAAYGNGRFVVVGGHKAACSTDGFTWTTVTFPDQMYVYYLSAVAFGDGKFVALADYCGKAWYSEDGITWTETTMPFDGEWGCITYGSSDTPSSDTPSGATPPSGDAPPSGNAPPGVATPSGGKFVAVCFMPKKAAYSADGITWTEVELLALADEDYIAWKSVAYGDNKFVAVANGTGSILESDNGIDWGYIPPELPEAEWQSITYGNGRFVAVARGSTAAYRVDGGYWTETTMPSSESWCSVTYGNGRFVAVASNAETAAYSTDGITWTETEPLPSAEPWLSVVYGNNRFLAVTSGSFTAAYSMGGSVVTQAGKPLPYLPPLVVNDGDIVPTGICATSGYYDTDYGVRIGYMRNGDVILSMKGGIDPVYPYLLFHLSTQLDVTITEAHNTSSAPPTLPTGLIYACVLHGITGPCAIGINMTNLDNSTHQVKCDITVEYVM